MSVPTYNSTPLVSRAGRDLPSAPHVRVKAETLPGVNGQFVQLYGTGGRTIVVRGVLEASGQSPAQAHQAVKSALRARQNLADGTTVATYIGTDGSQYANCILETFEAAGEIHVSPGAGNYKGSVLIEARILHLTP